MADIQLGVIEARYADLIWEREPVTSSELVKLTADVFNWKRTTAHNVLRRLCDKGIAVDIDTCGHVPYERLKRVLPYTDTYLYDLKLMDPEKHREYIGVDNHLILENLKKLSADGAKINIRLPLIDGVNASDEHIDQVIRFLKENDIRVWQVNLLKYHNTGSSKYKKLGRDYDGACMAVPDDAWLNQVVETFKQNGFPNIHIGG